jgi:hypothetical protein
MFEGKIIKPVTEPATPGALRAFDWQELVARLSAARDVRAMFARPLVAGASFHPQFAAGIAASPHDEPPVNFAALACVKWPAVTGRGSADKAGIGDREL